METREGTKKIEWKRMHWLFRSLLRYPERWGQAGKTESWRDHWERRASLRAESR